jgi:hypothetical protein
MYLENIIFLNAILTTNIQSHTTGGVLFLIRFITEVIKNGQVRTVTNSSCTISSGCIAAAAAAQQQKQQQQQQLQSKLCQQQKQ